jgi:hypothetical protein
VLYTIIRTLLYQLANSCTKIKHTPNTDRFVKTLHSHYDLGFVFTQSCGLLPIFWRNLLLLFSTLNYDYASKMLVTTYETEFCKRPQYYDLYYLKSKIVYVTIATYNSTCLAICSGYYSMQTVLYYDQTSTAHYMYVSSHTPRIRHTQPQTIHRDDRGEQLC